LRGRNGVEFVLSGPEDVLLRVRALRSRAAAFASRSSTKLSRVAFVGLLALPAIKPHDFHVIESRRVKTTEVVTMVGTELPPLHLLLPPTGATGPEINPGKQAKPIPPAAQKVLPWSDEEIATARQQCDRLLEKVTVVSEALPPAREGACGAPAPRELKLIGESKVKIEPPATLDCPMIAGLASWVSDKLQPAAEKNFGSPVVRIVAESYSCRNRYGLANAPISEHALMNAIDISAFVLANGTIIRVARSWRANAASGSASSVEGSPQTGAKLLVAASKLGARDIAKPDTRVDGSPAPVPQSRPTVTRESLSAFLHQAHDGACSIFGTVLGPDANDAHHDHFHLDMKARSQGQSLCE
jgi:hypothetical protein